MISAIALWLGLFDSVNNKQLEKLGYRYLRTPYDDFEYPLDIRWGELLSNRQKYFISEVFNT